ncbi:MAG: gliding motility lipoprotein GldB [Cytophagales bacterium]|nr:MAG: gliding motility lipoprotein GldB [Cytophagales bacterium]
MRLFFSTNPPLRVFAHSVLCLFLLLFTLSCKSECDYLSEELLSSNLDVVRLENKIFDIKNEQDMEAFLASHQKFTVGYLGLRHREDLPIVSGELLRLYQNSALVDFNKDTQKQFGDLSQFKVDLAKFFAYVKYHYPKFYIPEVNTVVTGFHFEKDLFVSDSLVVISLDYFLGSKAKYRPPYFQYFLERYQSEYIVPMIALAVSARYNEIDSKDETMLSNMIFYGKSMYFAKKMLPCIADSLITMYTAEQMKDVNAHAKTIWAHFIDKKLIFETNRHLIDKYVGESPKVSEIGEKCPGRIGRWLGWEIVKKYMEANPSLKLQELMAEKDAQKIFSVSKYKP